MRTSLVHWPMSKVKGFQTFHPNVGPSSKVDQIHIMYGDVHHTNSGKRWANISGCVGVGVFSNINRGWAKQKKEGGLGEQQHSYSRCAVASSYYPPVSALLCPFKEWSNVQPVWPTNTLGQQVSQEIL